MAAVIGSPHILDWQPHYQRFCMPHSSDIAQGRSISLDATDCYASVWEQILANQKDCDDLSNPCRTGLWGGRGKGGRGLGRRTVQPNNVVVNNVRLQYLMGDTFLEGATIKLLHKHVYALIGKNSCGKSTLLQRMHEQKIPGWSIAWSTIYIPPELPTSMLSKSPLDVILHYYNDAHERSNVAYQAKVEELEEKLDELNVDEEQDEMERICEQIALLEEEQSLDQSFVEQQAKEALHDFGISDSMTCRCQALSRGQRKRVLLSVALVCSFSNILLLDEPTDHLDVLGLIQLRRLIEMSPTTVVLVAHDVDLINDVATDIIDMDFKRLSYYPGNYDSYRLMKEQQEMHEIKQSVALEKKREKLKSTLQNLKEKPIPRRGGAKKKAKAVCSQRKKLNKHESLEKAANASVNIPPRKGLTPSQRLKLAETMKVVPAKEIQFVFPEVNCVWGEPLITAMDVGHGFGFSDARASHSVSVTVREELVDEFKIVRKDGYLFDYVGVCVEEGSRNCILGPTASGKSTLLKILAKQLNPIEGNVHHVSGLRVGYFDHDVVDIMTGSMSTSTTALEYLTELSPNKTEQELRGHLSAFGLSPTTQAKTPVCFFSGGEKCRFVLATIMLENPPVLCLDNPTSNLDVQSVQALRFLGVSFNGLVTHVPPCRPSMGHLWEHNGLPSALYNAHNFIATRLHIIRIVSSWPTAAFHGIPATDDFPKAQTPQQKPMVPTLLTTP
eukprot:scaffold15515_cov117-Cylindrotheca_fusiformis.AAC.2